MTPSPLRPNVGVVYKAAQRKCYDLEWRMQVIAILHHNNTKHIVCVKLGRKAPKKPQVYTFDIFGNEVYPLTPNEGFYLIHTMTCKPQFSLTPQ